MKNLLTLLLPLILFGCISSPVVQEVDISEELKESEQLKQMKMFLSSHMENISRLNRISYPILLAGVPECDQRVLNNLGMNYLSAELYGEEYNQAYSHLYGSEELLTIHAIAGSSAEKAGILTGDKLVKIHDKEFSNKKNDLKTLFKFLTTEIEPSSPVPVHIKRDHEYLTLNVVPEVTCNYPTLIINNSAVNAFADGDSIYVTQGMMDFASDNELALVVGHELAHNNMGHITKKKQNYWFGMIFDILYTAATGVSSDGAFAEMSSRSHSQAFESEADIVGLYFIARAGYEHKGAADFWRKMAIKNPASIKGSYSGSHPSSVERYLTLESIEQEITSKIEMGQELTYQLKVREQHQH